MTAPRDPDAILAAWLEEGPVALPEATKRSIAVTTRTTHRSRRSTWMPWRFPTVNATIRLVLAGAAVLALAIAGVYVLNPGPDGPSVGGPPSASVAPSPSPETPASPSASLVTGGPLDTADWIEYSSARYDLTISHPADWTVRPATRDWTLEVDAADWLSVAQESIIDPPQKVRVSAWSVATDADAALDADGVIDVEAWVEAYCQKSRNTPCVGIADRAVSLCLEWRDCHPGLLVEFNDDVQAFFTNGSPGSPMVVVAVWWGDAAPAVAPYGGSRRLLEAFLSTMCVWPEDARPPIDVAAAAC